MDGERGSPQQAIRNLLASRLPLWTRLRRALRNAARRIGPPPAACCGHPGEPGC